MNPLEKAQIQFFHKNLLAEFPEETALAVAWKTKEGQQKRFEVLSRIGNLNGASILDLGCGSGRDSLYFLEKGYIVTSVDASEEMVRLSSELTGQET